MHRNILCFVLQNLAQLEALKKAPGLTVMKSPEEDDGQTLTRDPKSVIIKNQDGSETIIVDTKPATEPDNTTKVDGGYPFYFCYEWESDAYEDINNIGDWFSLKVLRKNEKSLRTKLIRQRKVKSQMKQPVKKRRLLVN